MKNKKNIAIMDTIQIQAPEWAFYFQSKEDWDKFVSDTRRIDKEKICDYPDKYPCYGWRITTVYHSNSLDEQIWAFVYPA